MREDMHVLGQEIYGKSLYLPQFFYELKIALLKSLLKTAMQQIPMNLFPSLYTLFNVFQHSYGQTKQGNVLCFEERGKKIKHGDQIHINT